MIPAVRRALRRHGRLITVFAAVVLGCCATGAALALPSHSQSAPHTVDPALASQLSVFNRPPTSSDAIPAASESELNDGYASEQPDFSDSRAVRADDGQTSYLVPAQGGVCVINTNESFCDPLKYLPGAAVVDLCSPTLPLGQLELEWLLPDGATNVALGMSDGSKTPYPSGYNVYIARLPLNSQTPVPSTIEWEGPGGQHYVVKTPVPSDARSAGCAHPPGSASSSPATGSGGYFPFLAQTATSRRRIPIRAGQ